jgi:predicted membrane metal-binding protein
MLPASWAALAFVMVSAWLWAERGPGMDSPYTDAARSSALAAAVLAAVLAVTAVFGNHRKVATGTLVLAAVALALARAPLPRPPVEGESRIVELQGRLLRLSPSEFGGYWGQIDDVRSSSGSSLLNANQTLFFTAANDISQVQLGDHLNLRGIWKPSRMGYELKNCQIRRLSQRSSLGWMARGRNWVRGRLQQNLPPPHRAMALALLLGEKGELQQDQRQSYRRLGLLHLLAISGMHFWVWSALLNRLLPPRFRLIRLPLLFALAALANFGAPVVRAFTAVLVRDWLAGRGRGVAPFTLWSTAAWVELAFAHDSETSLGFLLTYLATAALLWGRPPRQAGRFRQLMQPSTTAFLGTMPTLHALQGTIEPWSIPFTPVFALMIPPRLVAGLIAISSSLAESSSWVLSGIHQAEMWLMAQTESLPAAPWTAVQVPVAGLLPVTFLAVLFFGPCRRPWRILQWLLPIPLLTWLLWPWQPRSNLICLPVGHGLCCAVIAKDKTLLFDAGSANYSPVHVVDRAILPSLNRFNARNRAWLTISHGDQDHTNAVEFLSQRMSVQRLDCEPGEWVNLDHCAPYEIRLARCHEAGTGDNNDGGLVMDIRKKDFRAVLIGDSFGYSLRRLIPTMAQGPIDLLLVPHHGLTTDGVGELLDHLQPKQAWASTSSGAADLPVYPLLADRGIPLMTTGNGALTAQPFVP